jgi:hypothetical protein
VLLSGAPWIAFAASVAMKTWGVPRSWTVLTAVAVVASWVLTMLLWTTGRLQRRPAAHAPNYGPTLWRAERRRPFGRSVGVMSQSAVRAVPLLGLAVWGSGILASSAATGVWLGAGLVLLLVLWATRYLAQGGLEVRWTTSTLAPGRRATFLVATTGGASRLLDAECLLRGVGPRDDLDVLPDGAHDSGALWSETIALDDARAPGPDEFVEVAFDLPDDVPASALDAKPPVYWELVVRGRTLWGTVTESFLVPIHAAAREPALADNAQ